MLDFMFKMLMVFFLLSSFFVVVHLNLGKLKYDTLDL